MAQPTYAPIGEQDSVRPITALQPPRRWSANRPGELRNGERPVEVIGSMQGSPGPDQGYALKLAEMFHEKLVLADGEHAEDVLYGAAQLASKRAGALGRAPIAKDVEIALNLFSYLTKASNEILAKRRKLFASASHHYEARQKLSDSVSLEDLDLSQGDL